MKSQWPDVILLDVEMPRMDGITFLKKLMQERPTPVVICSTLTESGAATTVEALSAGAVSIITKPKIGLKQFMSESAQEVITAIRNAARVNVKRLAARSIAAPVPAKNTADVMLKAPTVAHPGDDADNRAHRRHRDIDGRHSGTAGRAVGIACRNTRNRHRPTHAAAVHCCVCRHDWTACVRSRSGRPRTMIAWFPGLR